MFFRKKDDEPKNGHGEHEGEDPCAKADSLVRETLEELNRGLVVKRQVREKTARLVGSLRPAYKGRERR
jgi:hypothetical protein